MFYVFRLDDGGAKAAADSLENQGDMVKAAGCDFLFVGRGRDQNVVKVAHLKQGFDHGKKRRCEFDIAAPFVEI